MCACVCACHCVPHVLVCIISSYLFLTFFLLGLHHGKYELIAVAINSVGFAIVPLDLIVNKSEIFMLISLKTRRKRKMKLCIVCIRECVALIWETKVSDRSVKQIYFELEKKTWYIVILADISFQVWHKPISHCWFETWRWFAEKLINSLISVALFKCALNQNPCCAFFFHVLFCVLLCRFPFAFSIRFVWMSVTVRNYDGIYAAI